MDAKFYTYRVFWSEEDEECVGLCVEFPGLSWLDENQQTAFSGIIELVQTCINDLEVNNEPPPTPLSKNSTAESSWSEFRLISIENLQFTRLSKASA